MKLKKRLISGILAIAMVMSTLISSAVMTVISAANGNKFTDFISSSTDIDELLSSKYVEEMPLGYSELLFSFYQPGWGFDRTCVHNNVTIPNTPWDHDTNINSGWSMPITVQVDGSDVEVTDADFIPSFVTSRNESADVKVTGYKYIAPNDMLVVIIEVDNTSDSTAEVVVNAALGGNVASVNCENGVIDAKYYRESTNILDIRVEGNDFVSGNGILTKTVSVEAGQRATFKVAASADHREASDADISAFINDPNPLSTQKVSFNKWFNDNIPYIDVPDDDILKIYFYRWHTYRSQIRLNMEGNYVITEFLPNVAWSGAHNTIVCAASHHIYEGRWLRNEMYINDYMDHWFGDGQVNINAYSSWLADAYYQRYLVSGNENITDYLSDLENYFTIFSADSSGMYSIKGGNDGMEFPVSDPDNTRIAYRPTINSYMYANALALAEIAKLAGDSAKSETYTAKAEAIKAAMESIWDSSDSFYKAVAVDPANPTVDVREQIGFVPWMFNMPADDAAHSAAWSDFMSADGFYAQYGPLTAERDRAVLDAENQPHNSCNWNGPSWPFATTQTLIGMANLVRNYETSVITADDYFTILQNYAKTHYKDTDGDGERETPWLGENLMPDSGEWIQNRDRSSYYNHSQFTNLVITGLFGVTPDADNTLEIDPTLIPSSWDYFCLENLSYHGHNVTVMYDKDGTRYGQGKGMSVYVDGVKAASEASVTAMSVDLGAAPEKSAAYNELLALYNSNSNRVEGHYISGWENFTVALASAKKALAVTNSADSLYENAAAQLRAALAGMKRNPIYRIEAEDGVLASGASTIERDTASGGYFVANIGGASTAERNASVTMTVNVPNAGTYTVTLRVKGNDAELGAANNISVNGATPFRVDYELNSEFHDHKITVTLNEGNNTIKISGITDSSAWAQIDYIEFDLTEVSTEEIKNYHKYEAEDSEIVLPSWGAITESDQASGGKYLNSFEYRGDRDVHATFTVNVEEAGYYKISVYASAPHVSGTYPNENIANSITINGANIGDIDYAYSNTGDWNTVFAKVATVEVYLTAGDNQVTLRPISGRGNANIDCIDLYLTQAVDRYEAEDTENVLPSWGAISDSVQASGGKYLNSFEYRGDRDVHATFSVNVESSGFYMIQVFASAPHVSGTYPNENIAHDLTVNGANLGALAYNYSNENDWNTVFAGVSTKKVYLTAGDNQITLRPISGRGNANLDCIDVYFVQEAQRYEAEDAERQCEEGYVNILDEDTASGGKIVGGIDFRNGTNSALTFTVNVPSAGTYTISAYGATASDSPSQKIIVNGTSLGEFSYTATGSWSAPYLLLGTMEIPLNAGANTIRLEAVSTSSAILDCIDIGYPAEAKEFIDYSVLEESVNANKATYEADEFCKNTQGNAFISAYKSAENVLSEPMATQSQIDDAAAALDQAAAALIGNTAHTESEEWTYDNGGHYKLCTVCGELAVAKEAHSSATECNTCDWTKAVSVPYTVSVSPLTVDTKVGQTVSVNVTVTGDADYFASGKIVLNYTSSKLSFNEGSSVLNDGVINNTAGQVILLDYGPNQQMGTVYTFVFNAIADGDATVSVASAGFSTDVDAEDSDLTVATVNEEANASTITIAKSDHSVSVPDSGIIITESTSVADGEDLVYSYENNNYTYVVTVTVGGQTVTPTDNGDGTFTVENVTGNVVIAATRTPKTYNVTYPNGYQGENVSSVVYENSYVYTAPENVAPGLGTSGTRYDVVFTIAGNTVNADSTNDNVYTFNPESIVGDITVTVTPVTVKPDRYTVSANGVTSEVTVTEGDVANDGTASAVITIEKINGYTYTVTATMGGENAQVTESPDGTYTVSNVNGNVVFTVGRYVDVEGKLSVGESEYLKLNGTALWLIEFKPGSKLGTGVYTYGGKTMFWSSKYESYCILVVGNRPTEFEAVEVDVTKTVIDVDYSGDVNMTGGHIDVNDAQLVYNMYNTDTVYTGFTSRVTMEKFLRADMNGSKNVTVDDARLIVNIAITLR